MNEKQAVELKIAEEFLKLYNSREGTSYRIVEHLDAPDIRCHDEKGAVLKLEITETEDHCGDIPALRGRSESRSQEALDRRNAAKDRRASILHEVSSLGGNVLRTAERRIQPKLSKDYGPHVALVVSDVSPLGWDWDVVVDQLASVLDLKKNPFEKGIWILSTRNKRIYRVV